MEQGAGSGERVVEARIVLGGVASWPQEVPEAGAALPGTDPSGEGVAAPARAPDRPAKPPDNTDSPLSGRTHMARASRPPAPAELRERPAPASACRPAL